MPNAENPGARLWATSTTRTAYRRAPRGASSFLRDSTTDRDCSDPHMDARDFPLRSAASQAPTIGTSPQMGTNSRPEELAGSSWRFLDFGDETQSGSDPEICAPAEQDSNLGALSWVRSCRCALDLRHWRVAPRGGGAALGRREARRT